LQHGFNPRAHYTIPKHLARMYFGLRQDDFLILNLNRNQPRKRWDICLKAFAEVVSRLPDAPIKMVIATGLAGGWNLMEIFERELKKRNLTLQDGMKHIVVLDNPQKITDEETNILYNAADIGINTCDGEGFGLCNFEQAGLGIPQVVSNVGGFIDFFNEDNAIVVEPILAYYADSTRDAVCGEAMMCDYNDFADGIVEYYTDAEKRQKHGQAAREKILKDYKWSDIAEKLRGIVFRVTPDLDQKEEVLQQPTTPIIADEEDINIKDLQSVIQPSHAVDPVAELKRLRQELNKILTSLGQDSA
jgi:glycosyltransferase involved in cell wall biosynthesis